MRRILRVEYTVNGVTVRFKVGYNRAGNFAYDPIHGDELDTAILENFRRENLVNPYWGQGELQNLTKGFVNRQIPLIITPSLTALEVNQMNDEAAELRVRELYVTLFHPNYPDENHPAKIFLPQEIRISISLQNYNILTHSILPL